MPYLRAVWAATLALLFAGAIGTYLALPQLRHQFVDEHAAIENLTALIFGIAALCAATVVVRARSRRTRLIHLPIVVLSAIACLDEISFGETLLGYTPPTLAGSKIDGVHDLITMAYDWALASTLVAALLTAALLTAAIGAGWMGWSHRRQIRAFLHAYPAHQYLVIAAAMLTGSVILDLEIIVSSWMQLFEELLELGAGQTMITAALAVARPMPAAQARRAPDGAVRERS